MGFVNFSEDILVGFGSFGRSTPSKKSEAKCMIMEAAYESSAHGLKKRLS